VIEVLTDKNPNRLDNKNKSYQLLSRSSAFAVRRESLIAQILFGVPEKRNEKKVRQVFTLTVQI
jgi:hypothetical protein